MVSLGLGRWDAGPESEISQPFGLWGRDQETERRVRYKWHELKEDIFGRKFSEEVGAVAFIEGVIDEDYGLRRFR